MAELRGVAKVFDSVEAMLDDSEVTVVDVAVPPLEQPGVIRRVLAHHAEQVRQAAERRAPVPAPGYRPETLDVLFGKDVR